MENTLFSLLRAHKFEENNIKLSLYAEPLDGKWCPQVLSCKSMCHDGNCSVWYMWPIVHRIDILPKPSPSVSKVGEGRPGIGEHERQGIREDKTLTCPFFFFFFSKGQGREGTTGPRESVSCSCPLLEWSCYSLNYDINPDREAYVWGENTEQIKVSLKGDREKEGVST